MMPLALRAVKEAIVRHVRYMDTNVYSWSTCTYCIYCVTKVRCIEDMYVVSYCNSATYVIALSASSNRFRLGYECRTCFDMRYKYCQHSRMEGMRYCSEYQFDICRY